MNHEDNGRNSRWSSSKLVNQGKITKSCILLWKSVILNKRQLRIFMIHCDKIRNHYKGNKIRITLLIEYLKAITLFEISITPQARSIISSLNDSCWSKSEGKNTWLRFESLHKQDWWFYMQLSYWLKKTQMFFFLLELKHLLIILTTFSSHLDWSILYDWCFLVLITLSAKLVYICI